MEKNAYLEALRYMSNAKETLKNAKKDGDSYGDVKYVKTASGTAYSGVLIALDSYLQNKEGIKYRKPKSIEEYKSRISKQNKSLLKLLNLVYDELHLHGYYYGTISVKIISSGFDHANQIISFIK